jgi:hypothetical protein
VLGRPDVQLRPLFLVRIVESPCSTSWTLRRTSSARSGS